MRGLFIINGFTYSKSTEYKVNRLTSIFKEYGYEIDTIKGTDLISKFYDGKYQLDLKNKYSFCLYLDKDKYLATALEDLMPLFNTAKSIEIADDKMLTYSILRNNNIKTPKTIASPLNYNENYNKDIALSFLSKVEQELSFPIVVKKVYGSLGKQVYLVNNHEELVNIYKDLAFSPHIYQEYIGKEYGTDYRVFTINHKVVAAMKRENPYDFRSNIALGGKGTLIDLPKEYIKMAEKVSALIDLDYAGIDLLKGYNDEPIFNEINSNAFFTEIEKVSGIDISRRLVEHILNKIKLV